MKPTLNVREILLRTKEDALSELVSLSADKNRAGFLVDQVRTVDVSLRAIIPPPPSKYAKNKTAIGAITEYLSDLGQPTPKEEIAQVLSDGGFRGGGDQARANLLRSISSFTGKATLGSRTKQIKELNGLVGLYEWDQSRFVPR